MEYRVDFFVSMIGIFFRDCTGFLAINILFTSIGSLGGWHYHEILFLYSFSLLTLTPLQLFFDKTWDLRGDITSGVFLKYYFKPLNSLFYYMSEKFDIKGISQLLFATAGLVYASIKLDIPWTPLFILEFTLLAISSSLIMISLLLFASVPAFWITDSYALLELIFNLRDFSRYPLTIFSRPLRWILSTLIPMGFIAYHPTTHLLHKNSDFVLPIYATPVVGLLFFFLAVKFWEKGVNSWSGTGS